MYKKGRVGGGSDKWTGRDGRGTPVAHVSTVRNETYDCHRWRGIDRKLQSTDLPESATATRVGSGSGVVGALLVVDRPRRRARFRRTGRRRGRPGREPLLDGRGLSTAGGRLMAAAAAMVAGGSRGRGRSGEPIAVLADLAHERSDLLEVGIVAGATGRPPVLDRGGGGGGGRCGRGGGGRRQTVVHYRRAVGLVFLQVPVQVGLLAEAPFAQRALERFLLVVDVAHVSLQIGRYAERTFAIVALVRLFARVRAEVASQVGAAREHFLTELARIPAKSFRTMLYMNVYI